MKIGIAQINPTIGDFVGNTKKILHAYDTLSTSGAELIVTPELAICGYPPRDLLYRSDFVPAALRALDDITTQISSVPLLVGYPDLAKPDTGQLLHNRIALLRNGKILTTGGKMRIPFYDVFNEPRYFRSDSHALRWKDDTGRNIGVLICEDGWHRDHLDFRYGYGGAETFADDLPDLLIVMNASPFAIGKRQRRHTAFAAVARQHHRPIIYVNAIGGQDDLIFDGGSFALDTTGARIAELPQFTTTDTIVDLAKKNPTTDLSPYSDMHELEGALCLGLRDYLRRTGFTRVTIGLSGGIDSAVTAAIATRALGADNVLGVTMPSDFSSPGSVDDSITLAKNLGIKIETLPISSAVTTCENILAKTFSGTKRDVTEENLQARIRGILLMAIANKHNRLLLATGNKSELAVGYCTIYGDMCGALAVIGDVYKTQVYTLAAHLNRDSEIIPHTTIDKAPSAELRPDQTDQDTLPPYDHLDAILQKIIEGEKSLSDLLDGSENDALTRWIYRRLETAEWKRRQAPPVIRVTRKAFGSGRQIPIARQLE